MEVELTTEYSDSQLSESIEVEKLRCPLVLTYYINV